MDYTVLSLPNLKALHIYLHFPPDVPTPLVNCDVSHSEIRISVSKREIVIAWEETRRFCNLSTIGTYSHAMTIATKRYLLQKQECSQDKLLDHIFLKIPVERGSFCWFAVNSPC
jgi:hypothetical protein